MIVKATTAAQDAYIESLCSHTWIDPAAPPIARTPIAPIVGPLPRQMKAGHEYVCPNCGAAVTPIETA